MLGVQIACRVHRPGFAQFCTDGRCLDCDRAVCSPGPAHGYGDPDTAGTVATRYGQQR